MRQISLRVANDLHTALSEYARSENLSLNAVCIQALKDFLEADNIEQRLSDLEHEVTLLRAQDS